MDGGCIDLTVTSPPYDNLRSYKGYSFDFENIAKELYRVIKPGGVLVWVVGDATVKGSETGTSFRQALYFKDVCGFNLHDTMIYAKKNFPPKTHRRYEQQFEYMFVLSKGSPKTFNPLTEVCSTVGGTRDRSKLTCASSKDGGATRTRTEIVETKATKYRTNIWYYGLGLNATTRDKAAFKHPAIFPEKLAEEHILSWSNPGDLVLDPFGGSGTTAKMAALNGRNFIHIDCSEEYMEIARQRVTPNSPC